MRALAHGRAPSERQLEKRWPRGRRPRQQVRRVAVWVDSRTSRATGPPLDAHAASMAPSSAAGARGRIHFLRRSHHNAIGHWVRTNFEACCQHTIIIMRMRERSSMQRCSDRYLLAQFTCFTVTVLH